MMQTLPITSCDNYYRLTSDGSTGGGVAPTITVNPSNVTKAVGEQATFSVTATGTPTLHYSWRKNGAIISGAPDSSSYTTPAVTAGDNGAQYTVMVSNAYGNTLSATGGVLTVTTGSTAPSITTHPAGLNVTAGQPATFTVVASGSPTLTYQWYKAPDGTTAGAAISGATSASYTIASTATPDAGYYYCTVTNGFGSATSNRAQLQVGTGGSSTFVSIGAAINVMFVGQAASVTVVNPGAASSEPTLHLGNLDGTGTLFASYGSPTGGAYSSGANGTINQTLPSSLVGGAGSVTNRWRFYAFVDPGYLSAPTLHVRVASVTLSGGGTPSTIAIKVYYGSTLITTLKTYSSSTITSETFPQDLTTTLNTTGGYPTLADVMTNLRIEVEFVGVKKFAEYTNSITFNYYGFETLG
jgi:hypothetical protein